MFKKFQFTSDFKVKIISLLVAFGMWIFVMEEIDPITVRSLKNIPITEISNIEEIENSGLTLSYNQNLITNIDFRGKRSVLADYVRTTPNIIATVDKPKFGKNDLVLYINAPSNVEYSFDPAVIEIVLEESVVESRKVDYELYGNSLSGYEVIDVNLSESSINIEGPRSQVDKVSYLLAKLDVSDVSRNFTSRVKLIPVNEKGDEILGLKVHNDYTVANVNISAYKEVPVKFDIVSETGNIVENLLFKGDIEKIKIFGDKNIIDNITQVYTYDIHLDDINNNKNNVYSVDLQPISNVQFSENNIKISPTVDNIVSYEFDIPKYSIEFEEDNINKDSFLDKLPDMIKVSFKTTSEYKEISEKNVKLYIDNTLVSDNYDLEVKVDIPVIDKVSDINSISF